MITLRPGVHGMKKITLLLLILILLLVFAACKNLPKDQLGPEITNIQTSGEVLVISDCAGTSVTISANVNDSSAVKKVLLWYRTGNEQQFSSADMKLQGGTYQVNLNGSDFLHRPYGTLEFYISAEDGNGKRSRSAVNQNIQFLPCINN